MCTALDPKIGGLSPTEWCSYWLDTGIDDRLQRDGCPLTPPMVKEVQEAATELRRLAKHNAVHAARPFTEIDWMGLAGAKAWGIWENTSNEGLQPVIREFLTGCLVCDADTVQWIDSELETWMDLPGVKFPCQAPALAFLNGLPEEFSPEEYGFVEST